MKTENEPAITSFNYHIVDECNMHCGFCFATFRDTPKVERRNGRLGFDESRELIRQLGEYGFKKANFAGGEPFLYQNLPGLVAEAKQQEMITSVITNASTLVEDIDKAKDTLESFDDNLDWFAVSIDSVNPLTLTESGRVVGRNAPITPDQYLSVISLAKSLGMNVKINSVVHAQNSRENMNSFIKGARPDRWKVMRMLPIEGQRPERRMAPFAISSSEFDEYRQRHSSVYEMPDIDVVFEDNEDMQGSYVMVDPMGRFFDNTDASTGEGGYTYSDNILDVGVRAALEQIHVDADKFVERGGDYYLNNI